MNYYNQKLINRINKNENDSNFVNENNLNNPYINKKTFENNYKPNLIPNIPYENNLYQNNLINKNFNYSNSNNSNNLITNPFSNQSNVNNETNKSSDTFNNYTITNKNTPFNNVNKNDLNNKKKENEQNQEKEEEEEELPLLEELGINFDLISKRMKSVFMFYKIDHSLFENSDLSGPLLIVLSLGFILLLAGKASFSYIYLIGIISSLSIYLLLNMMSQNLTLDLYRTISMLGYSLLPLVILSIISILINLRSKKGYTISFFCILWSALTASRFFEVALCMNSQRYLVAYPIFLLYSCFALIIIF
ncbi:Yip1 protein, putative [Plasmodium relictum]|uniref:Protein YIPF n=1 Tax=Plasmodium relictum TaxID=85471 RepID=A0A1J1H8H6_PLARL|nr:Yip1 protein, putative [Plasmodium relictum]CRH01202.1 Yip1 protein, putative [Plasmodium relictum]